MNKVLITICGRAGSKGFKNKNIKNFLGVPLVYYTAAIAEDFKKRMTNECETLICLNTDSGVLKDLVSKRYKDIEIIERAAELCGDKVAKMTVWHNCLDILERKYDCCFDFVIDLDITSPLRQIDDVINAYKTKLQHSDCKLIYSVCDSRRNPYFNMVKAENGFAVKLISSNYTTRQEAPAVYDMNASIYIIDADYLRNDTENMLLNAKSNIYRMFDTAVLDIDSEQDFEFMEIIAEDLYKKNESFAQIRKFVQEEQ